MKKSLLFFFLGLCCWTVQTFAQGQPVTGKVTSADDGLPLPGVTVKIKGTTTGVVSNNDGIYRINANTGQVLVFTFIGNKPQEVTVGASKTINVKMVADASNLNEVVVTAYNIAREKPSLGYATQTVKGDEVSQTQRDDFFGGLQGRVAGLSVNSTNGSPGASAQIVLRGFVSLSGDNSALIVVDGVPINNNTINQTNDLVNGAANRDQDYSNRALDINPNDIETYTIMKGPEATALYGSAGASGAILITTKKGKAGKASINYSTSFRSDVINKLPQVQQEFNSGSNGVFSGTTSNLGGPRYAPGTQLYDNVRAFYRTGFGQKQSLSFEGGSDKFTYRWSNDYSDDKGVIPTTRLTRYTTRLTGMAVFSPLFRVTTSLNYVHSDNVKANKGLQGTLMELVRFPSAYDINNYQDANGNRVLHLADIYSEYDNPLWDIYKDIANDKTERILANTNFQLAPTKWLNINAILGADVAATNGIQVYNAQSYKGSGASTNPTGGSILPYEQLTKFYNGSLTATAKAKLSDFNGTFILGTSVSDYNSNINSQFGTHMYDPNFYSINNTLPTTQRTNLSITRWRTVGAFAQAVLGYKSLVYLTLTGRVDGSSRLMPSLNASTGTTAEGHPYYGYPSASLAFNFTDLAFFKPTASWLDHGKLRVSYAKTGKDPWRQYSLGTNYVGANSTGGGYALSYYAGNPTLKPETSTNFETGMELDFLNDRLSFDFNYYNLLSENQIINPRLSYGGGFILELINGGTVRNRGFEITMNGTPVKTSKFNWTATANFSLNRGKVISIANQLPELYDSDTWIVGAVRSGFAPGSSNMSVTGTRFDRNKNGQILISPTTGMPTTSDTNYYPIGDRQPKFNIGLTNRFTYKDMSLSFLWDLRYGGDVINGTEYEMFLKQISVKTLDRETPRVITGVLKDGLENTDHPTVNTIAVTPYYNSAYYTTNVSPEMFIEHNIKALRLRDVTFSYNLPQKLVRRTGFLQSAGLFFTVTDLFLLTNYSGLDPESNATNASSGGVGGFGLDYGNVGKPISYNLGLRVKL